MTAPYQRGDAVQLTLPDREGEVRLYSGSVTEIAQDESGKLWHVDAVTEQGDFGQYVVDADGHGGRVMPDGEISKDLSPLDDYTALQLMNEGQGAVLQFGQPDYERARERDEGLER
jgi:hypothetical protein